MLFAHASKVMTASILTDNGEKITKRKTESRAILVSWPRKVFVSSCIDEIP